MKILKSRVTENKLVTSNVFRLSVESQARIKPGQFFMLKTLDNAFLLPRPISVNDVNGNILTFIYRIEGQGTKRISSLSTNDEVQLFGPLGNGFDTELLKGKIGLVGGGIGVAPLLYLSKILGKKADVYLGYRDLDNIYLYDEFKIFANKTILVTEDGSLGEKGFVTDYIDYEKYDFLVTCGPEIMMNTIVDKSREKNTKCFVSLERRMACGMGACLGCTVETKMGNKRACKEGPVFDSDDLL